MRNEQQGVNLIIIIIITKIIIYFLCNMYIDVWKQGNK